MGWSGGLAHWRNDKEAFVSVAFTWLLDDAYSICARYRAEGLEVRVGGPAVFLSKPRRGLERVALVGGDLPDAVFHHNAEATFASRGCPVGCWFCIVPKMEGKKFTLLPEFPVRPILCDNNLSALPGDYQDYIVSRYIGHGVRIKDANSGFEPRTFSEDVYRRWQKINDGPWRFAYDDTPERSHVERVMRMLRHEPARKKRVYCLIGNEPFAACMDRINEIIAWGGEPHVQPFIKLNETRRDKLGRPIKHPRFDWTPQLLTDVARWANRWLWRKGPFETYRRSVKARDHYDSQQGLFV